MLGIGRDSLERLGGDLEEDAVDDPLVLQRDGSDLLGQGENDVELLDREQILCARLEPARPLQVLALGAVAIRTAVVGDA